VPYGAAVYLGVVQFFFACSWIVYVIYLPSIAETAGIAKRAVIWILMIDQIVFAVMDLAMGLWADRVAGALRRLGPAILAISCVSCVAFLVLPRAAVLPRDGLLAAPVVVGLLILVWTATSSALRAPLWVLLSKHAATPSMPFLSALCLTGVAVSGAISPYLGVRLHDIDPGIPFAVSALTLLATTSGLIWVERYLARGGRSADVSTAPPRTKAGPGVTAFFVGCGVLSIGFQVHFFLNSSGQYLRFARPSDLEYLMPVFWIGFNLLMFPGAALARRYGGVPVMAGAAVLGVIGMLSTAQAGTLATLIAAQFLAGGAWGAAMMAAFAGSMAFGHTGREGLMVGTLSSLFALAAFFRIATVAMDANKGPTAADVLPWLPLGLWLIGGCALLAAALASRRAVAMPRPM
jgi:hypothetical protein